MTWTGLVWREAGPYGPDGIFVQQTRLGRLTFPVAPAVGAIVKIGDQENRVLSVVGGFCHVGTTGPHLEHRIGRDQQTRLRWQPAQAD